MKKVPLTCLVEYLGFKALCMAIPYIEAGTTMVQGPYTINEETG